MQIMIIDQSKKLPNLIGLCVLTVWLEVQIAGNIRMLINVMAAIDPHKSKAECFGKAA